MYIHVVCSDKVVFSRIDGYKFFRFSFIIYHIQSYLHISNICHVHKLQLLMIELINLIIILRMHKDSINDVAFVAFYV